MSGEPPLSEALRDEIPPEPRAAVTALIGSLERRIADLEAIRDEALAGSRPALRGEGDRPGAEPDRSGPDGHVWRRLGFAAAAVAAAWAVVGAAPFVVARWLSGMDFGLVSDFGQAFQVADSFFAALSVAGVAYALSLQVGEQADARRLAAESNRRAAASDARSAELAMLAALVQGRAALVRTSQSAHEEALGVRWAGEGTDQAGEPPESVRKIARIRKEQLSELLALIDHAERLSGWAEQKAAYLPTPASVDDATEGPPFFRRPGEPAGGPG